MRIAAFVFLFVISLSAAGQGRAASCKDYLNTGPLSRSTGMSESNVAPGGLTGVAQRYNNASSQLTDILFYGRVDVAGSATTVRVNVYQETQGKPGFLLGQTTVSIPTSDTLVPVLATFSAPVTVANNIIVAIEPNTPASDDFFIGTNSPGNGQNLYLNLVKFGTDWYNNLANGNPDYDFDYMILPLVQKTMIANFTSSTNGSTVTFTNSSTGASSFFWDFGDGSTSTEVSPVHTYTSDNTYTVQLIARSTYNPDCGDTTTGTVTITTVGLDKRNSKGAVIYQSGQISSELRFYLPVAGDVTVFSPEGKKVACGSFMSGESRMDVGLLTAGVYYFFVPGENALKFIKL